MNGKYKTRIGMALAYMGGSPIFLIISSYLVYFYTNVVGLNAGVIGTIMLVSRALDGVSDLVFGNVIDKTRTKMGVCRPWVFRMSIFGLIGIVSLFAVPKMGLSAQYVYVFVSYNIANAVIATLYQMAIISLPTYLTRDQNERGILYIWANTGQFVTQFILSTFMFTVVTSLGGDQKAWLIVTGAIAFVGSIVATLAGASLPLLCLAQVLKSVSAGGKLGSGLSTTARTWIMAAVGFNGMVEIQSAETVAAIQKLYSILPLALAACMAIILFLYDLDKRYPQIMADLKSRANEQ